MTVGGVVLAGGASRRMGADKALLELGGRRLVDHVFALAASVCDGPVLVAGRDYGLPFVADPEPLAGPVAGILAGARALREARCTRMLVLAVDAPAILAQNLSLLLAQKAPGAAYDSFPLPMAVALDALPEDARDGWPLRRLVERAGLKALPWSATVGTRLLGANDPAAFAALKL